MVAVRQQCADSFPTVQRLRVARMLVLEGHTPSALSVQCCRVLTVTRYRPHHAILSCRAWRGCTLLRAQSFIGHDHHSLGEEKHDGDPAPGPTAVCPRAGDARGLARLSPPDPRAQVPWLVARAAPPAGGPAVGVVAARARAAPGRR